MGRPPPRSARCRCVRTLWRRLIRGGGGGGGGAGWRAPHVAHAARARRPEPPARQHDNSRTAAGSHDHPLSAGRDTNSQYCLSHCWPSSTVPLTRRSGAADPATVNTTESVYHHSHSSGPHRVHTADTALSPPLLDSRRQGTVDRAACSAVRVALSSAGRRRGDTHWRSAGGGDTAGRSAGRRTGRQDGGAAETSHCLLSTAAGRLRPATAGASRSPCSHRTHTYRPSSRAGQQPTTADPGDHPAAPPGAAVT